MSSFRRVAIARFECSGVLTCEVDECAGSLVRVTGLAVTAEREETDEQRQQAGGHSTRHQALHCLEPRCTSKQTHHQPQAFINVYTTKHTINFKHSLMSTQQNTPSTFSFFLSFS
jgi:hypothetical protein